jgi:hypothetical protein
MTLSVTSMVRSLVESYNPPTDPIQQYLPSMTKRQRVSKFAVICGWSVISLVTLGALFWFAGWGLNEWRYTKADTGSGGVMGPLLGLLAFVMLILFVVARQYRADKVYNLKDTSNKAYNRMWDRGSRRLTASYCALVAALAAPAILVVMHLTRGMYDYMEYYLHLGIPPFRFWYLIVSVTAMVLHGWLHVRATHCFAAANQMKVKVWVPVEM